MARSTFALSVLALAAVAGCRDTTSARDTAARDALQRDLDLAQASAVSLAERSLPPTRFVSALEAGERPSSGNGAAAKPSRNSPNKAPRTHTQHAPPAVAAVAQADAPQTAGAETTPVPAPVASPVAAADAGPAPSEQVSVSGPSDGGIVGSTPNDSRGDGGNGSGHHGRGIGDAIGGIIGVVIRGGGVGDGDHCERDQPRGGRLPGGIGGIGGVYGGLPIPMPTRSPRGGIGFPRR